MVATIIPFGSEAYFITLLSMDKYNNFLPEKRLESPGSQDQFDYHLSLMKQFRKRQDEGASFSKARLE